MNAQSARLFVGVAVALLLAVWLWWQYPSGGGVDQIDAPQVEDVGELQGGVVERLASPDRLALAVEEDANVFLSFVYADGGSKAASVPIFVGVPFGGGFDYIECTTTDLGLVGLTLHESALDLPLLVKVAPGHAAPAYFLIPRAGGAWEVALRRGAQLEVRVTNQSGVPCEGVAMTFAPKSSSLFDDGRVLEAEIQALAAAHAAELYRLIAAIAAIRPDGAVPNDAVGEVIEAGSVADLLDLLSPDVGDIVRYGVYEIEGGVLRYTDPEGRVVWRGIPVIDGGYRWSGPPGVAMVCEPASERLMGVVEQAQAVGRLASISGAFVLGSGDQLSLTGVAQEGCSIRGEVASFVEAEVYVRLSRDTRPSITGAGSYRAEVEALALEEESKGFVFERLFPGDYSVEVFFASEDGRTLYFELLPVSLQVGEEFDLGVVAQGVGRRMEIAFDFEVGDEVFAANEFEGLAGGGAEVRLALHGGERFLHWRGSVDVLRGVAIVVPGRRQCCVWTGA